MDRRTTLVAKNQWTKKWRCPPPGLRVQGRLGIAAFGLETKPNRRLELAINATTLQNIHSGHILDLDCSIGIWKHFDSQRKMDLPFTWPSEEELLGVGRSPSNRSTRLLNRLMRFSCMLFDGEHRIHSYLASFFWSLPKFCCISPVRALICDVSLRLNASGKHRRCVT
jgi:hypothetical protein